MDQMKEGRYLLRGLERMFPNEKEVITFLEQPRRIYAGIDPTGPTLHLGHLSILLKLRDLQNLGHTIILLIGDFTARIGDPTGKSTSRVALTAEEVQKNEEQYLSQIQSVLDVSLCEVRHNSEWLGVLSSESLLNIASEFTVGQMIERDMFQERMRVGAPIYLHEFLYPLLQGYDSVALEADGEVGGNDQTFNMLAGRTLLKRRGKEKVVFTTKLLVDPSGKKMGKTEGNMVFLTDEPSIMYGKILSWPDSLLPLAFEILTRDPLPTNEELTEQPFEVKKRLARSVTGLIYGDASATRAEENFVQKFVAKEISDDIPLRTCSLGTLLVDVVNDAGLVSSRSEWRRLVEERAVEEVGGILIRDPLVRVEHTMTIRIGKSRFLRIEC
ncbi:MAG: tyrosine--tRNA ligase [Candidatus Roizmanbacteria bacterium]|nr:tyrosine--tRNA ligase [Candidatus Roizmanbacteria bacterium]